ncbi:MAG: retroviral-like aspartic protease family protein [Bacteroidaceae bacterium]|nr:retroviral-like aspartic protease family protein [Bacteroidaceae bacterium]
MRAYVILIICILFLYSCGNSNDTKKVAVFEELVDSSDEEEYADTIASSHDYVFAVPFKEVAGVKTIEVKINDVIGVDMIVDTGCSGVLISLSEVKYLIEKGTLTRDDIVGTGRSQIADGSIVENDMVRLNRITIGSRLTVDDVVATVSNNIKAPLLLGNGVLDRVESISIDNKNKHILFHVN